MSEGLLEALSTLYHHPDQEAKKRASLWLEDWRLTSEAWKAADGMLHSASRNVEVLFFCAQTLVFKIQQDFEELPVDEVPRLRDSLVTLLLKFSREEGMEIVKKQLALAIAAFCAHVPSSFWSPSKCIPWMAERFWHENDVASVSSLMELLVVFPEEAKNERIGLHPKRRTQYQQELEESFPQVMEILEKCRSMAPVEQLLSALGSWLSLCEMCALQGGEATMDAFVQLATEALESPGPFSAAVDFLSELLYITGNVPFLPEMQAATQKVASALIRYVPQLTQGTVDEAKKPGLARLFCDLGCFHEDLVLTQDATSSALIAAILAATSDPDEDVHQYVFDFWERLTYRAAHLIKTQGVSPQRVDYYRSIFERFMTALVELAKLPEDYLEMSLEERRDVSRREVRVAMADAVDVLGDQRSLQSFVSALSNACQGGTQNWRQIEALLFAIDAVYIGCKKCKTEMVGPLFQALGAVPDSAVIQSAMCECLATYAPWLPDWVEQTGSDPLATLIPVIFKNMAQPEWAVSAVEAFVGLCKYCRRHLAAHATQLLDLHRQVLQAANAFHHWIPVGPSGFCMKETDALEVMTSLIHGMSRTENKEIASQFIWTLSEGILQDLNAALESLQSPTPHLEAKLQILVARLKTVFKGNTLSVISAQLLGNSLSEDVCVRKCSLGRICPNLLQLADRAASHDVLIEEISTCLRYAIKSAGESGSESLPTLATALPQLFSATRHCGYLYVASEIAKIFGQNPVHTSIIHQMVMDQISIVCNAFQTPSDFVQHPDLADDAFLMAGRVLNYCPEAMLSHVTLITQSFDTATKGILVQHEDACRSILRFLSHLMETGWQRENIQQALAPRGSFLIQVLMAGVVGCLPLRIMDDVSRILHSILTVTGSTGVVWISESLAKLPDAVLSPEEKRTFVESVRLGEVQKSERAFLRLIDDFADVCRRSRVVRQAAQSALTPQGYV